MDTVPIRHGWPFRVARGDVVGTALNLPSMVRHQIVLVDADDRLLGEEWP